MVLARCYCSEAPTQSIGFSEFHLKLNSKGSLLEQSAKTHHIYYSTYALHPHLPRVRPTNPFDREICNDNIELKELKTNDQKEKN